MSNQPPIAEKDAGIYADCTCGHPYESHGADGCFPACGCSDPGPAASAEMRDDWGLMYPPSVWVGRTYPVRKWAENKLPYNPGAVLVHRRVTEWTRVTSPERTDATDD